MASDTEFWNAKIVKRLEETNEWMKDRLATKKQNKQGKVTHQLGLAKHADRFEDAPSINIRNIVSKSADDTSNGVKEALDLTANAS